MIKVTIYLTDMSHFEKIVALRQQWFSAPYPADTIVEVNALALPELMIEIEAIAVEGLAEGRKTQRPGMSAQQGLLRFPPPLTLHAADLGDSSTQCLPLNGAPYGVRSK